MLVEIAPATGLTPDGKWKLTLVEATQGMQDVGSSAIKDYAAWVLVTRSYKAMLDACPPAAC